MMPLVARTRLAAALLLAPAALAAQAPPPATELSVGMRLRVLSRDAARSYLARLERATRDSIWVRALDADTLSAVAHPVALASLGRLEYSRGRSRHVGRNALYGMVAGALTGALIGGAIGASGGGDTPDVTAAEGAVFLGAVLVLPGGIVGAMTGAAATETWAPVALPLRPRLGLARVPGRGAPPARALTLGLTVRTR